MTWLVWLVLAVIVAAIAAVTGIAPKGGRPVARTGLMTAARFVLLIVVLIFAYMAYSFAYTIKAGNASNLNDEHWCICHDGRVGLLQERLMFQQPASSSESSSTTAALVAQTPGGKPPDYNAAAKQALAQLDGTILVFGLREPVEVLRDRWGIPHIFARNTEDLFFAQGYVVAQDRMWQLEMWRRNGEGRLAEVLGPEYVTRDRFARLLAFRGNWDEEFRKYHPEGRAIFESFARGVNASHPEGDRREQDSGRVPNHGLPAAADVDGPHAAHADARMDAVAQRLERGAARARRQDDGHREGAGAEADRPGEGVHRAGGARPGGHRRRDPRRDARRQQPALESDPPQGSASRPGSGQAPQSGASTAFLTPNPWLAEPDLGSNNWVIGGSKSTTGKPIIANDPHREVVNPALRYVVHLNAPGWNVIGATEPGLPGISIGHNDHLAWGFTILGMDQQDLYVEETDPQNPNRYLADGQWRDMDVQREVIWVRGQTDPVTVDLKFTRHGPVLHENTARNRAYALRWVGAEPGGAGYLGSLNVLQTKNWKEFNDALPRAWYIPSHSLVYADVEGNYGYIGVAQTPVRKNWDGLLPVPGKDSKYEWAGYVPFDKLPKSLNGPAGFYNSSNNDVVPKIVPGYSIPLGYEYSAPYRYDRVHEVLSAEEEVQRIRHGAAAAGHAVAAGARARAAA